MINYLPNFIPNKFLVIGVGGTGSRLVPLIAQFVKSCPWILNPEITLIDHDIVEEKNLTRQNFIVTDVGKPKAVVLAQRYSRAFNININALQHKIESPNSSTYKNTTEIATCIHNHCNNTVIFMCVDSGDARRAILHNLLFAQSRMCIGVPKVLIVDSGNENDFGQIVFGIPSYNKTLRYFADNTLNYPLPNSIPDNVTVNVLPLDLSHFENMKDTKAPSCADLDQTMAINTLMANHMFGILQNIIYAKPIGFNRLNISLSHGCSPEYLTLYNLAQAKYSIDSFQGTNLFHSDDIYKQLTNYYTGTWKPMMEAAKREAEAAELKKKRDEENARNKKIAEELAKKQRKAEEEEEERKDKQNKQKSAVATTSSETVVIEEGNKWVNELTEDDIKAIKEAKDLLSRTTVEHLIPTASYTINAQ